MTAVLLAVVAVLAVVWLARRGDRVGAGMLAALIGANALAWPLGVERAGLVTPLVFAFGTAWIAGGCFAGSRDVFVRWATVAAAVALVASQYVAGMSALGETPAQVSTLHLVSEAGLLVSAAVAGLAASSAARRARSGVLAGALALILAASYVREPATLAIVSLWATGVTMSLPPVLYIAGFGAFAFAAFSWGSRPDTRHLAIALALLLVAGLQPQALHHGITAFLGLTLLSMGRPAAHSTQPQTEATDAV
jgi:hypothetical protein